MMRRPVRIASRGLARRPERWRRPFGRRASTSTARTRSSSDGSAIGRGDRRHFSKPRGRWGAGRDRLRADRRGVAPVSRRRVPSRGTSAGQRAGGAEHGAAGGRHGGGHERSRRTGLQCLGGEDREDLSVELLDECQQWLVLKQTQHNRRDTWRLAVGVAAASLAVFVGGYATAGWRQDKETEAERAVVAAVERCWKKPSSGERRPAARRSRCAVFRIFCRGEADSRRLVTEERPPVPARIGRPSELGEPVGDEHQGLLHAV